MNEDILIKRLEELQNYIENNPNINEIVNELKKLHPYDFSRLYDRLSDDDQKKLLSVLSIDQLADILPYLDLDESSTYLEETPKEIAAKIVQEMDIDDATDIISEVNDEKSKEILESLDKSTREDITELANYDDSVAGSIMTSSFLKVKENSDIKDAMRILIHEAPDVESINTLFVVNNDDLLLGTINLKDLIIAKTPCNVNDIMQTNFKFISTTDDASDATKIISDYDIYDLPVLDDGIIKGIITMDDAFENVVEEAEDDYAKLAGLIEDQDKDEPVFSSIKKRIPWLAILLVLDIFVSIIISSFDYIFKIDSLTILVIFQPVILGLAGNCGTQSLAVTVRNIGNNELETKKTILKHLTRETTIGITTGLILGLVSFVITFLLLTIRKTTDISIVKVAFVVSLSIFLSLISANLFGSLIPIIFYKIKIDPAVASGPFITTLIDILSIAIYYILATVMIYNFIV